jgi:O-6-methylguanine DNA methyltransferase
MNLAYVGVKRDGFLVHAWASRGGIVALHLGPMPPVASSAGAHPVAGVAIAAPTADETELRELAVALERYLGGEALGWDGALDVRGVPAFSRAVFDAVRRVPFGSLTTYRTIAREIGSARAGRAVGSALHRNPFPIVVPCHRVVREGGALGGFACGVAMKRRLLALEAGQRAIEFP